MIRQFFVVAFATLASGGPFQVRAAPVDDIPSTTLPERGEEGANSPSISELLVGPAESKTAFRLAEDAFKAGDEVECLAQLRAAVAKNPHLPPPALVLARMQLRAGQFPETRRSLESFAAKRGPHVELYLVSASLALYEGRLVDADVHLDKAESIAADENFEGERARAQKHAVLTGRIAIAERRKNWNRAQDYLAEAVKLSPSDARLRDRWATALHLSGRPEQAFEQFDIAFHQEPRVNPPEISMAAVSAAQGEFKEADQWYEKAVQKYPDNAATHLEWGVTLLLQDRTTEAKKQFEHAAELGLQSDQLLMYRGLTARQLHDTNSAYESFRQLLQNRPKSIDAQYHLAVALADSDDPSEIASAQRVADSFLESAPDAWQANAAAGRVAHKKGQLSDALSHYRSALAIQPSDPELLYFAGSLMSDMGNHEQAKRFAQKLATILDVKSVWPTRPEASEWIRTETQAKD